MADYGIKKYLNHEYYVFNAEEAAAKYGGAEGKKAYVVAKTRRDPRTHRTVTGYFENDVHYGLRFDVDEVIWLKDSYFEYKPNVRTTVTRPPSYFGLVLLDPQPEYDPTKDVNVLQQLSNTRIYLHPRKRPDNITVHEAYNLYMDVQALKAVVDTKAVKDFMKELDKLKADIGDLPKQLDKYEKLPDMFQEFQVEVRKDIARWAQSMQEIKHLLPKGEDADDSNKDTGVDE